VPQTKKKSTGRKICRERSKVPTRNLNPSTRAFLYSPPRNAITPALGPTNPVSNKLSPLRVRDPAGGIGVANANRKALNPSSASSLLYFSPHTPAHPSSELRSLRGLANSSSSFLPAASIQAQQPKRWRRSRPPSSSGARRGFPASRRRGATT
jgi:hypothetical protein